MPYDNRDPKRDPNIDNHPCIFLGFEGVAELGFRVSLELPRQPRLEGAGDLVSWLQVRL